MSRKIILIKQELLLLVYELNRSGLLAENEKIRPILAQLEKLLLCDLSPSVHFDLIRKQRSEERFSRNAETDLVCRLLLEKKNTTNIMYSAFFSQTYCHHPDLHYFPTRRSSDLIILIKQELLLLVYELNRSGLLAENEKIRPILAQLEKLLLCDLSPSVHFDLIRKQ